MKPFPQNLAFNVVVGDAGEEGLSEMAQRVSMMLRQCLSVRLFLLTSVPTFCSCSCWNSLSVACLMSSSAYDDKSSWYQGSRMMLSNKADADC